MEANELRIGNWVDLDKEEIAIDLEYFYWEIEGNGVLECTEPIPLTEDWLLKFGFEKKYNEYYLGDIIICEEINDFKFGYDFYEDILELKHVHQLQNLYYALTEKELIYNIE